MKQPFARPVPAEAEAAGSARRPRAFAPGDAPALPERIEPISDAPAPDLDAAAEPRRLGWLWRVAGIAGGLLLSLAVGLAAERLIADLFAAQPWLGWLALGLAAALVLALLGIAVREVGAVLRLDSLERLRRRADAVLENDRNREGAAIVRELGHLYARRPELARPLAQIEGDSRQVFDGAEQVRLAERLLMAPLDARARTLTAASARRVALVTTVSPRAVVDITFVAYESIRLGADIARLYGARPGVIGTWRLAGAVLAHLAVTGGLVLTDGVVEQLVGQGLAAKLSARLGEGVVNGLMTVRVGIAAMRVVRPLPFAALRQPLVKDFVPELANVLNTETAR
ncbi:YcjF family protein [Devosia sp.]|uniref:YcjF family protein n=1 Tax=Devosia sp. TaxID=1871048 RepID=UPI0035ADC3DB